MTEHNKSTHIIRPELGQKFRTAREEQHLSRRAVSAQINHITLPIPVLETWKENILLSTLHQLTELEKGDFPVDSKKQHTQQELIHQLSELYHNQTLEDCYCRELCPFGQGRRELKCNNIKEITLGLSSSLDYLFDNTRKIANILRDGHVDGEEMSDLMKVLNVLQDVSASARAIQRWSGYTPDSPANTFSMDENPYVQARKEADMIQQDAARETGIHRTTIARLEGDEETREIPTQNQVVLMSKAYLSPRIRNFYCYHDCPIGGRLEPLDIHNSAVVSLMLISSLLYSGDLNKQLRNMLADGEIKENEERQFQASLTKLLDLSRQAETMVLGMTEKLSKKLLEIIADKKVTEEERPIFLETIEYLEQLNYSQDFLDELKENYL